MTSIPAIPGYLEALTHERLIRDSSFLVCRERVGRFDVVPMTLWHYLFLRSGYNALLLGGEVGRNDLFRFLWMLSPDYTPNHGWRWFVFCLRFKRMIPRGSPKRKAKALARLGVTIAEAKLYVAEALQDRPPRSSTVGFSPEYYSDAMFWCGLMGREFGWSRAEVMATPLKVLFQALNEIKDSKGSKVPLFNPSDRVINDSLAELNARISRN